MAMTPDAPTLASGKICYLEIPCSDPLAASLFYADVFGWEVRERPDGRVTFTDAVNEVSGHWVTNLPASSAGGIVVHVMVADLGETVARLQRGGGRVISEADAASGERYVYAADPAGNLLGIYEQSGLAATERAAAKVAAGGVAPVPEHLTTVTPRLVVPRAVEAIAFYREAFGAWESSDRHCTPDGTLIHTELTIGDAVVMVTEGEGYRALLSTHWPEVDVAWERALSAGATVVFPLADQFYGERGGRLEDPFGQQWMLASRTEILSAEEIAARASAGG